MTSDLSRGEFLAMVDHTLLAPETSDRELTVFLEHAVELGVPRVCLSPSVLTVAARVLAGTHIELVSVAGFPSGAHTAEVKAAEAAHASDDGATEIDVVANLNLIKSAKWQSLSDEFETVRAATTGRVLKVILESAALSGDELVESCRIARDAGYDFVKTSTGFHPAGGATPQAVTLMRETVGDTLGVKASGGIRTPAAVRTVVAAGATRLGLSATARILADWDSDLAQQETEPSDTY